MESAAKTRGQCLSNTEPADILCYQFGSPERINDNEVKWIIRCGASKVFVTDHPAGDELAAAIACLDDISASAYACGVGCLTP
jgi:hypothetical protein